jgi:membrane protease YdiL (CAAX protease family)
MKIIFLLLFFLSGLLFLASFFVPEELYIYFSAGSLHIGLFFLASFFLWKDSLKQTLDSIGFPGKILPAVIYTMGGLMAIFASMLVLGIIAIAFDFNDQQLVADKIEGLPLIVLLFAVTAAPVSEELFFRAFLVRGIASFTSPLVGIVLSSALFGMVHFAYGSVIEVLGAGIIGLILAVVYHKSKSITPCLLIHMLYNFLAIIVMRFLA